ncbi:MAG TPA: rhamnulose-1-phosphate aldolase [bacterium]
MPISLNKNLKQIIQDVGKVGQFLWQKGWAEKNAGNLSIDVTDLITIKLKQLKSYSFREYQNRVPEIGGRSYLVTGTGTRYRDIENDPESCLCVLRISGDGKGYHVLWGAKRLDFKPTSELPSHLQMHYCLYRTGAKEKVVLHTHPNELIALTHLPETNDEEKLNYALWGMIPEAKIYVPRGIGLVPYRLTASEELAEATVKALERKHKVVMWEKHGALAVGADPFEAFDLIDAMNKSAILYLLCNQAGVNPQGLTREQIDEIGRTFPPKD